jgi:hypothetical protein
LLETDIYLWLEHRRGEAAAAAEERSRSRGFKACANEYSMLEKHPPPLSPAADEICK